jgi:hypothetical protein
MFDNTVLNSFAMESAALIPIITAICQAFKMLSWVKDKYLPFISMFVGVGITLLMTHDVLGNLSGSILLGILFGLAASGLYSGLSSTSEAIKMERAERLRKQQQQEKEKTEQSK